MDTAPLTLFAQRAGLARAKAEQERGPRPGKKAIGRPRIGDKAEARIRELKAQGIGLQKIAATLRIGVSAVQRVTRAP
jgi:DNA invertase Pin-like site-specific DNA recombinase